jgi:hypothetical protein
MKDMEDVSRLPELLCDAGIRICNTAGPTMTARRLRDLATHVTVRRSDVIEILNLNVVLAGNLALLRNRVAEIASTAPEKTAGELKQALEAGRIC